MLDSSRSIAKHAEATAHDHENPGITQRTTMPELKSCGVLVVRGDPIREFLLMRHPDRWDLPKGHVDPGETELACAMRELWEETGITADAIALDPTFRFTQSYRVRYARTGGEEWPKTLVVFLGRLTRDTPITTTEHAGFQWFPWQPPHQIQPQTIDPLLAEVEQFLRVDVSEKPVHENADVAD